MVGWFVGWVVGSLVGWLAVFSVLGCVLFFVVCLCFRIPRLLSRSTASIVFTAFIDRSWPSSARMRPYAFMAFRPASGGAEALVVPELEALALLAVIDIAERFGQ